MLRLAAYNLQVPGGTHVTSCSLDAHLSACPVSSVQNYADPWH
jgi:hypothetical protein